MAEKAKEQKEDKGSEAGDGTGVRMLMAAWDSQATEDERPPMRISQSNASQAEDANAIELLCDDALRER